MPNYAVDDIDFIHARIQELRGGCPTARELKIDFQYFVIGTTWYYKPITERAKSKLANCVFQNSGFAPFCDVNCTVEWLKSNFNISETDIVFEEVPVP